MIKKQDLRVLMKAERDFNMVVAVQAITRLRLCRFVCKAKPGF